MLAVGYTASAADFVTGEGASSVIGHAVFTDSDPSTSASTLWTPAGVAMDPTTGKVFVADYNNNRVLRYTNAAALATGASAEVVFGQTSFSNGNSHSASSTTMSTPEGVAFDQTGRLYVADTGNNRVLRFDTPSTTTVNGVAANLVLGQGSFSTTNAVVAASGMNRPTAVAVGGNYVWVADSNNHRVIGFSNPSGITTSGINANKVLGQPNYTSNSSPLIPNEFNMDSPEGLAVTKAGTLWVSDAGYNRLLRYKVAGSAVNGTGADAVLGQPDFTSADPSDSTNATTTNLHSPEGLAIDDSGSAASLWVADHDHHRVLRYDDVENIENDAAAAVVLGQSDFISDNSDATQSTMDQPFAVAVDTYHITATPETLWVVDMGNSRVLRFSPQTASQTTPPPAATLAGPTIGGSTHYKTKKSKVTIKGSASGAAGLVAVQYKGPKGGFRAASGTGSWSFKAQCKPGKNRFTVVAVDALGRTSAPLTIIVKRAN